MCNLKKTLASVVVSFLACSVAMAQEGRGSISGIVTDASGGTLVGAQVSINPAGVQAVSDASGQFFVNNLNPGRYTVTVHYVGFAALKQDVNVAAGQTEEWLSGLDSN